ncbi:MAG: putative RNA-binding protein (virulence factor B family) [Candidatus Endobugula sp.]|jgi:predicted RNA-binding protein (virulence factor B family)
MHFHYILLPLLRNVDTMPKLDQTNRLTVTEVSPKGAMVDGLEYGALTLRDAPANLSKGDIITAFVYRDASERITATAAKPLIQVGQCAYLKVVEEGEFGAFLDWGLPKNLLLPYAEQAYPIREGASYVVYAYLDNSDRMAASTLLHHHLDEDHGELKAGDAVDLLIAAKSELGFKAVINNKQLGLIYHDELSQPLRFGMRIKGWVKAIREDGKIDLSINSLDQKTRDQLEMRILKELHHSDGRIEISDKSSPEIIFNVFKVSKKNFKRALGSLYKQRLITIESDHITSVKQTP